MVSSSFLKKGSYTSRPMVMLFDTKSEDFKEVSDPWTSEDTWFLHFLGFGIHAISLFHFYAT